MKRSQSRIYKQLKYSEAMQQAHKSSMESKIIEDMGHSLSFLVLGVLEGKMDEFAFKTQKLNNFYQFVQAEKYGWLEDKYDTHILITEAKGSRSHVYEACCKVPYSQLLRLAEVSPKKITKNPNLYACLQCGYCIVGVWTDRVLEQHYRMSKARRAEFFAILNDWIDSYWRGYLSNEGIREMFIEDIGWDLTTGEKVC